MPDHPIYTCKTCHYSGPEIETIHGQGVECRIERPNGDGFPIMPVELLVLGWGTEPGYCQ